MIQRMCLAALTIGLFVSTRGFAQPLVDRVPADATVYIGWRGADALANQYNGSHLQGMVDASQLRQAFQQTWPSIVARIAQEDGEAAKQFENLGQVVQLAHRHPTAAYLIFDPRAPKAAVIVQAGKDADQVADQFRALLANRTDAPPMKVFRLDDLAVLAIGFEQGQMAVAGAGDGRPSPLAGNERLNETIKQVNKDAALVVFANFDNKPLQQATGGQLQVMTGLKSIAASAGFDGKQWRSDIFINSPAPRSEWESLLDAKPLSDNLLRAIPKDADWMSVHRLDLDKVFTQSRATAEQLGEHALKQFDQVMGATTLALGTNLQQNLFAPLGDEWAFYVAPRSVGGGLLGGILLNRTDDPAKVNRALSSIAIAGGNVFSNAMRKQNMSLQLRYLTHNGQRISYLPTPGLSPAWAIKDNLLILGFYPQTVAGALDAMSGDQSILDNEDFLTARKQLPDNNATSISFINLPRTAPQSYGTLLALMQTYMGMADLMGAQGQPMLLPPLAKLKPHLTASVSSSWVDDAGWHHRSIETFPMSGLFGGEFSALVSQFPAGLAAAIPAFMQANERAEEVRALSHARQIMLGMMMHAQANKDALPQKLDDLTPYLGGLSMKEFIYLRPADKLKDIRNAAGTIVIYQNPEHAQPNQKLAVAYADGHAQPMTVAELSQALLKMQEKN